MTFPRRKTRPLIIAAGILLSVFLYLLIAEVRTRLLAPSGMTEVSNPTSFFYSRLILWAYLLLIYLYVIGLEKQKFLLWSEKRYSLKFYIISILVILATIIIAAGILSKIESYYNLGHSDKLKAMLQLLWKNKLLLLFTTLSAGIMEELMFRGYLMPRLQLFLKMPWLTILISSLLFGLAHYSYGNWSQMINPFFIGIVFAFHYQKYRNLKILIICHFLIDLLSIVTTH